MTTILNIYYNRILNILNALFYLAWEEFNVVTPTLYWETELGWATSAGIHILHMLELALKLGAVWIQNFKF